MIKIEKLLDICQSLKLDDIYNDLTLIKGRLDQPNKEIIIPLVGEFSSGKTSLINTLTDSQKLETASKATTATIFEVRFGNERSYAEIINENGQVIETDDISAIKNDDMANVQLVRVFDTSNKVPSTTVLVDTPGLSSNDPRHKLTLTSYLPFADAIFLLTDVNQQITRSLLDFIETTKLASKPIYLIITKCDTKTKDEVAQVKKYMVENLELPINNIVCTSAKEENLNELFDLFADIQNDKNAIVLKALENRVHNLTLHLARYVEQLLQNSSSASDIDSKICELQDKLRNINRNIDKLIRDAADEISEKGDVAVKAFRDNVYTQLYSIVESKNSNYDAAVYSAVNSIASMILSNYKKDIQHVLLMMARERQSKVEAVPLQTLESLDLSSIAFNEFAYNVQLNLIGHENDKFLGGIAKVGLAAAAVAAIAFSGGAAAVGASGAVSGAVKTGQVIGAVDTATDVASIASNMKTRKFLKKTIEYGTKTTQNLKGVEQIDEKFAEYTPHKKGVIETGVSWITDKLSGKPQRRRAINDYIASSLLPEFTLQMESVHSNLVSIIRQLLYDEIKNSTGLMEETLKEMKQEKENEKETYNQKISQLKEYLIILKS